MAAALIGAGNGYARGAWLSVAQYSGLVAGVVVGAVVAPAVPDLLGIGTPAIRRLLAVLVLVVGGSAGSSLGYALGAMLRGRVSRPPTEIEHLGGAVFSAAAVLAVAWFLGLSFDRGPSPDIARAIQSSAILRALDRFAPRPPGFLARVEAILAEAPFPQTFAGLTPALPGPLALPASIDTTGVRAAESQTYRVEGNGCNGLVSGSAYPISSDHLITNAHVVSGTARTRISQTNPDLSTPAAVVLFDPGTDVAILYVPGANFHPLAPATGARGSQGAVIGYPEGLAEDAEPAVVDTTVVAQGRDIYDQQVVDRQIYVLTASVRPGNSGGPLVDLTGHVLGLVFAASSTDPSQAYALTNDEIAHDAQQGAGRTAALDLRGYPCAA